MAKLMKILHPDVSAYKDRRFPGDEQDWERAMRNSTTVYVGNLSFYTREEQVYEVFSKVGHIKQIVMGLDKFQKTPCGFCFVVYYLHRDAEACVKYVNGLMLDERPIRVDFDWGYIFENKRQFGRGRSGGQVRDEFRRQNDPERGGLSRIVWEQQMAAQMQQQHYQQQQHHQQGGGGGGRGGSGHAERSGGGGYAEEEGGRPQKRQRAVAGTTEAEEHNPRFRKDASDDEDGK